MNAVNGNRGGHEGGEKSLDIPGCIPDSSLIRIKMSSSTLLKNEASNSLNR